MSTLGSKAGKSDPAEQAPQEGKGGQAPGDSAMDAQLRSLYANVLDEPIPDQLMSLLNQVRERVEHDGAHPPKGKPDPKD